VSLEAKDLRGNEPDELRSTVRKLEEDLFKHRLKKTTSQLENTMLIRHTRRDIARVRTVLAERLRELGSGPAAANQTAAPAKAGAKESVKAGGKAVKAHAHDHDHDHDHAHGHDHPHGHATNKATGAKPNKKKPAAKSAVKKET
jgi:large subunit ribosomal protein L29